MQGLGNDFIVIDAISQRLNPDDFLSLTQQLCDRRFGIGADGIVWVLSSKTHDFQMRIFNSDGSEPQMCGNGIRCFAKFIYENQLSDQTVFSIQTKAGPILPGLLIKDGKVEAIEVDMGPPILERGNIPILGEKASEKVIEEELILQNQTFTYTGVSMGNPHAVLFVEDLKQIDIETLGPVCETHPLFPEKINTHFVQVLSPTEAVMVIWERGAGETLACGTGACAVLVAGVLTGKLSRKATLHLPGGDLIIEWQASDNHVLMTGPAETIYKGKISI
jgi:diaminopimelate epimerase